MNRSIKFRIWTGEEMCYTDGAWSGGSGHICISEIYTGYGTMNEWSSYKVMQCIGIKDHTGQEIYEGDILRLYDEYDLPENYKYHRVKWGGEQYPAFCLDPGFQDTMNDFSYLVCATEAPKFEVAGNIFENKDLLKEAR